MSAGRELVASLNEADQRAIHEALRASVDGPLFVYFWACPLGDAEEDRRWLARGPHHCLTTPEDVRRRGAVDWWEFHAILGLQPEDTSSGSTPSNVGHASAIRRTRFARQRRNTASSSSQSTERY